MPGARDHLDHPARDLARARPPGATQERDERPAITAAADPRLAVTSSGTHADLMRVQRSAGNAAVTSLVAPAVQRAVIFDEVASEVQAPAQADAGSPAAPTQTDAGSGGAASPGAASPGAASPADAGGEANHTITAGHIGLNAPLVEASGIVRAQTVIADTIIASSYTPGAGNVM